MNNSDTKGIDFRVFRNVNSHKATYPAGTEILKLGDTGQMMYIVETGVVGIQIHDITVEQVTEGNIFGEMGIVDPQPHSARVVAFTDVTVYALTQNQFLQLISSTPAFAIRVMRVLVRRMRAMNSRLSEATA